MADISSGRRMAAPPADEFAQFADAPADHDEFAAFADAPPEPSAPAGPSTWTDVAKSFGSGLVRGAAETAMLPVTAKRAAEGLVDRAIDGVESLTGTTPGPDVQAARAQAKAGGGTVSAPIYAAQDATRAGMDATLHKPETVPGRYAETAGEFVPSVVGGPGSFMRKAADVVVPAFLSQTAGEATQGTALEPWARVAGGLAGNAGLAGVRAAGAPERLVRSATRGLTDADFDRAQALHDTGQRLGIPLSGAEALDAAANGGSKLPDLQRVVEGSGYGGPTMQQFYRDRPDRIASTGDAVLDAITRRDPEPSTLGPRVASAAQRAMAATPEGQALVDAIFNSGPRITPEAAGTRIQGPLRGVYDRREGMRNALADRDFAEARAAEPQVDVGMLDPRAYEPPRPTTYRFDPEAEAYAPARRTENAPPQPLPLSGPDASGRVQTDPRQVVGWIDGQAAAAKGATRDALQRVRGMLFTNGAVDTSVEGLSNVRGQVGTMITTAVRDGDNLTAARLRQVQAQLDDTLSDVPAYAEANEGFAAASRPLAPFHDDPVVAKIIETDPANGRYALPADRVPNALQQGGPSASRTFNEVAPPDARQAYEQHITTQILDGATDAAGRVDPGRLSTALRDNADLLAQHPDVAQRLQGIVQADAGMAGVRSSPLGRVADATTTQAAADAILPAQPHVGGEGEIGRAVGAIAAQDPELASAVVRQRLGDQFDQSTGRLVGGQNQYGGARFAKDVAGTRQQEANLRAAVGALPGGEAARDRVVEFIDTLRATGHRKPQGSATSFNQEWRDAMSDPGLATGAAAAVKSGGLSVPVMYLDKAKRATMGRRVETLADLFTAPDAVPQIRAMAARRGGMPPLIEMLARQALQTPNEVR